VDAGQENGFDGSNRQPIGRSLHFSRKFAYAFGGVGDALSFNTASFYLLLLAIPLLALYPLRQQAIVEAEQTLRDRAEPTESDVL
jgi:Na+/melibiose symporter-like transporter